MASPFGWLRALLALLQQRHQTDVNERWVEPGNEITRAILDGSTPLLAAANRPAMEAPMAAAPTASAPLVVEQTPLPQSEVALEVEAPAAAMADESAGTSEAPAAKAPRKAGRAA
jgi:hypothetical protein